MTPHCLGIEDVFIQDKKKKPSSFLAMAWMRWIVRPCVCLFRQRGPRTTATEQWTIMTSDKGNCELDAAEAPCYILAHRNFRSHRTWLCLCERWMQPLCEAAAGMSGNKRGKKIAGRRLRPTLLFYTGAYWRLIKRKLLTDLNFDPSLDQQEVIPFTFGSSSLGLVFHCADVSPLFLFFHHRCLSD